MSKQKAEKVEFDDTFDSLFQEAEKADGFWISKAKLSFTEEMLCQMNDIGVTKAVLADRLKVSPAQITRLCSGVNNFTLETMVRVARALGCEFKSHLQPAGTTTQWIDFLKEEPEPNSDWKRVELQFNTPSQEQQTKKLSHVVCPAA